jgi:hypothetical protein
MVDFFLNNPSETLQSEIQLNTADFFAIELINQLYYAQEPEL